MTDHGLLATDGPWRDHPPRHLCQRRRSPGRPHRGGGGALLQAGGRRDGRLPATAKAPKSRRRHTPQVPLTWFRFCSVARSPPMVFAALAGIISLTLSLNCLLAGNGLGPFAPEESKETALGFRGTRLCWQSLVCYTFARERTTRGRALRFLFQRLQTNRNKGWQMVQTAPICQPFCPLLSKGFTSPPQRSFPISLRVFLSGWPHL